MRRIAPLAIALLAVAVALPAAPGAAQVRGAQPVPGGSSDARADADTPLGAEGRWIVVLKKGADVAGATERARGRGVATDHVFRHSVRGYAARLSSEQVATLRADPAVEAIVPDEIISIAGQSVPRGVRRVGGVDSPLSGIDGRDNRVDADVAIVDTGIDRDHEDLNVVGGINCATDNPAAWGDVNGHGTHVAGTVGALDNGIGVVGVAPGVRLWAVRILDSAGNGLLSWYVCGLDWIAAQRDPANPDRPLFEAVNMSVAKRGGDDGACGAADGDIVHQAICRLVASGVTVVAAAGNNSFDAAKLIPASYDEVITVSALADLDGRPGGLGGRLCYSWGSWDRDDTFAGFSNYGRDVDLIAPGKCTLSTVPGDAYGWLSGTSMAAPLVAGAVALYKASRPDATPLAVKTALITAGTLDWSTGSDPDPYHEPLLDVSHIVAAGDFMVDATPGIARDRLVAAGSSVALPVQLVRAEDFSGRVDLTATVPPPLGVAPLMTALAGSDETSTTVSVSVPAGAPSGRYSILVTGSDGTRERASSVTISVDGDLPVIKPALVGVVRGTRLDAGTFRARAWWAAATDATSAISGYETQWRVDAGSWDPAVALGASAREVSRSMAAGHVYSLRLRARDAAGNWSDWVEAAPFAPLVVEESRASLVRTGTWSTYRSSAMSGGTTLFARRKGAAAAMRFSGRAVALVAPKGPSRGRAQVWIDGVRVATIGLWSSVTRPRRVMYTRSWANSGSHSIRVVVVGTAGHPRVDIDAFLVFP